MAQPARRGLRAARRSGLTSPDPVRTPPAATATRTLTPAQEPRTSRRTGERQDTHARIHPGKLLRQESGRRNELPESAGGLRLRSSSRSGMTDDLLPEAVLEAERVTGSGSPICVPNAGLTVPPWNRP